MTRGKDRGSGLARPLGWRRQAGLEIRCSTFRRITYYGR